MRASVPQLDLPSAYVHAACLVYIDGLGSGKIERDFHNF